MPAYNVVRFRVKPGREQEFIEKQRMGGARPMRGFIEGTLIKTGDRAYCLIGHWDKLELIVAARPAMVGILDSFRDTLEDLGDGLGVTDALSGEAVLELMPPL